MYIKDFAKNDGKVVTFTGGEATLRSDFKEIVDTAKSLGLKVGVLSNGLLWSQDFINSTKKSIDEVQISIDGYDADSYMSVRGSDTFDLALETVDRLIDAGIRVTVAVTPLLETLISNENEYISFAEKLIEKYREKEFFVKFNTELLAGRTISPTETENDKYRTIVKRIKARSGLRSEDEGFALDHIHNTLFNNCGYGGLSIASNGDVYLCNLVGQCAKQANVRNQTFEQILSISQKARMLSDINNLSPCKECALKYLCGGGCRIKNFKALVESDICAQEFTSFIREVPCTRKQKEQIYRLMVSSNSLFYR